MHIINADQSQLMLYIMGLEALVEKAEKAGNQEEYIERLEKELGYLWNLMQ